jgi:phosphoserine phosphatase
MHSVRPDRRCLPVVGLLVAVALPASAGARPLASWNDGAARKAIVAFVEAATTEGSPGFVPRSERIAVFDNDGTLWGEQPAYFQLLFAIDRVKALAAEHPEWRTRDPFRAALAGDLEALAASGKKGLLELVMATHAGNTTEEFRTIVRDWLGTARHPTLGRPYTELVYQPMLELLAYLRSSGFETYIVSGGGIEFLRAWAEEVYGVPPQQVVGSSIETKYEVRDGVPSLVRLPAIDFIDDEAGKPVGIHRHIGRRPIAAFGNSDGDFQMLEWVTSGPGPHLGVLIHHDDAEREFAYDRSSHIGRLARGLDEAARRGWTVVSMQADWRVIHPAKRP